MQTYYKQLRNNFLKGGIVASLTLCTIIGNVYAADARLSVTNACDKVIAELIIQPGGTVTVAKLNGEDTKRLEIAWDNKTSQEFVGEVKWANGDVFNSSKVVTRPSTCGGQTPTPTGNITSSPTRTPTPSNSPTGSRTGTPTRTPTSTRTPTPSGTRVESAETTNEDNEEELPETGSPFALILLASASTLFGVSLIKKARSL